MKTNRKTRPQPSLASLTTDEYHQLTDMVRTRTYDDILQQIVKPRAEGGFDLDISIKPLQVLHRRVTELDRVNKLIADGQKLTLAAYDELQAGQNPPTEQIHNAILNATWLQVQYSENTPHQLLALQRLADFPARSEIRENREQIYQEKHTHKIEMDTFRKEYATERLDLAKRSLTLREKKFAHRHEHPADYNPSSDTAHTSIASASADDDNFDYENMPSISPNPLPPEVIARNLAFSKKLREGKIIIDRSGPYVRAVELPDAPNPTDAATPTTAVPPNTDSPITDSPITEHSPSSPSASKSDISNQKSEMVTSFLSPEVIANTNLYDQKIDCGEIRVIYAPGKHYEIEYCNRADQPALERLHKSAPLRFFEDPTRTQWLPALRTFGKNPYIPPTATPPNTDPLITDHSSSSSTRHLPSALPITALPITDHSPSTAPSPSTQSQTLEERVDHYNNLRAQEYLAFDQQRSRLSKHDPYPNYVTQYRYCPCGNACPCPIHEDEEKFGQYFTFFWSLSPFHSVYANTLRARGLPYNKPKEDLA